MKHSAVKVLAVLVAILLAAYWYWSPFLAAYALKSAAARKDAEAFNAHVDYPRLRESVKGQLSGFLASQVERSGRAGNESAAAGAALGALFGTIFSDKIVEALVRPEVVMRMMNEARLEPSSYREGDAKSPAGPDGKSEGADRAAQPKRLDWTTERANADKLIVYIGERTQPSDGRIGAVLERTGFATWKLTEIRLPDKLPIR